MTEYKVGDIVSYKGNKGIVREILDDGTNSEMHRVDVTKTGIHYLYAQELDLYVPSLTDDQQVVLEMNKSKLINDLNDLINNSTTLKESERQLLRVLVEWIEMQEVE